MDFLRGLRKTALDFRQIGPAVLAARVLAISGLLAEVPAILAFIQEFVDIGEFQGAFWDIGRLLDDGSGVIADADILERLEEGKDFPDYSARVMAAYSVLRDRIGRDDVRVFRGALFEVRSLVRLMRQSAGNKQLDPRLRQIFEATTGIDCSSFYADRAPQPLQIDTLLKDFEDAGGPDRFAPGRRYFFGHPVPD